MLEGSRRGVFTRGGYAVHQPHPYKYSHTTVGFEKINVAYLTSTKLLLLHSKKIFEEVRHLKGTLAPRIAPFRYTDIPGPSKQTYTIRNSIPDKRFPPIVGCAPMVETRRLYLQFCMCWDTRSSVITVSLIVIRMRASV